MSHLSPWRWFSRFRSFAVAGLLGVAGCPPPEGPPPIDERLWRWINCIECIDNELDEVVAMGNSAIPGLRYFLFSGPPPSATANYRERMDGPFQVGRGGGRGGTGAVTVVPSGEVVNAVVDDFKARYRIRAGHALGLIKNDSARAVLCIARNQPFRADVIRMIDSALVLVTGTCP